MDVCILIMTVMMKMNVPLNIVMDIVIMRMLIVTIKINVPSMAVIEI